MSAPRATTDQRIGVLIDADNTSSAHAGAILEECARFGQPTVKRAYGDWTTQHLVGWKSALLTHAIQPVQQFANTRGKNSTDSALIIDAMDLLYAGNLERFALVSSDSDFTRLATRLREEGRYVVGIGRRTTPEALVAACDEFKFIEVITGEQEAGDSEDPEAPQLPDLPRIFQSAIDGTSDDDGWSHLSAVGSHIQKRHASFDPRNYGFAKLVALARAQDYLDVEQTGNVTRVRRRPGRKGAAKR
ncbi:NYN domain-containing protein [Nocardioides litoris]|uniref:NYN domain-containing protein n=1 Tax=Nocardioides litoris TaxID=1926648 RepID=UPI0011242C9F|nr:NYN domain-containing protein [Nocardioides litoris]